MNRYSLYYVVDDTPAFGYEVVFEGTDDECLLWARENRSTECCIFETVMVNDELLTSIVCAAMVDAVVLHEEVSKDEVY